MTNKQLFTKIFAILVLILFIIPKTLAFTCGDGTCDITETHYTCPEDCPSGGLDNYCDKTEDDICDPDCFGQDPDCEGYKVTIPSNLDQIKSKTDLNIVLMIGLLFLVMFVIFIVLRTINKQKGTSYLDIRQRQKQKELTKQDYQENPFKRYKYMFKK